MTVGDRHVRAGGASHKLVLNLCHRLSSVRCIFDGETGVVAISQRGFLKPRYHRESAISEIEGFSVRREGSRSASRFTAFLNLRNRSRIELGRMSRSRAEAALINVRQILGPLAAGKDIGASS
jgi:hypothetical protein